MAFLIDGCRTPFVKSNGLFADYMAHDLGRFAVTGLLHRTSIEPNAIKMLVMGTVIQDPNTSNVAREIALLSELGPAVPAFTTTMACISSNAAITCALGLIEQKKIDVAIAGGTETFSDPPIRISRGLRHVLVRLKKAKTILQKLNLLKELSIKDMKLDVPSPKEFTTGLSMGQGCERMVARYDVGRKESDVFALKSHQSAISAWKKGFYGQQVVPVPASGTLQQVTKDDGPREDTSLESLAKLKPAFYKEGGINTAGNSSPFTDGAAAVLIANEDAIKTHSLTPLARIRDFHYSAGDPMDELLLGPGLSIPIILARNNLKASDIGVWEFHEAFASQVLANLKFLRDGAALKKRLGKTFEPIDVDEQKLNNWGGSLSLGHPFGATGARLALTAAQRLKHEGAKYAVIASCAAGSLGTAMLLERA
jgi:acetyl-CoA acyltransferase